MTRLECGHDVELTVGTRLWCYYDVSFGTVTSTQDPSERRIARHDPWWTFDMDGSPYKARHSHGYYNATRLACFACGIRKYPQSGLHLDHETFELKAGV